MKARKLARRSLLLATLSSPAWALPEFAWPTRPLRLVIPFAAGGSSDLIARLLSEKLAAALGQPVLVDARPGANGIVASKEVARATDNHTLLLVGPAHAINAGLYPRLPYDSARDFAPVALIASPAPLVLAVPQGAAAATLPDLLAEARRQPGTLGYASAGTGNLLHLAGEMLAQQAGVKLLHVPYNGSTPALNDLVGGRVQMMFNSALAVTPMVRDGRVRLLAQTGARRSPALPPELPAVAEAAGLSGFEVTGWFGLLAPARMPQEIVLRINAACSNALAAPELRERLALLGSTDPTTPSPREFAAFLDAETRRYARVIGAAGLNLDTPGT